MALDFPASPSTGQTYAGPGGAVWQYDGAKWVNGAGAASTVSSFNTRTGAVTLSSGDVTTALTFTPASTIGPVFTGDARAVTPAAGDNDTSVATSAFVQAAQRYTNYVDNSGFAVNQRAYVSGAALAAGLYGLDRWKAGAGGCTYTFTAAPPSTTITITAGTLQQIIEGASVAGGNYMLSWTGTAQGRVGAGSYAASPVAVVGATAGANLTIEFNAGTLAQVKLEPGTVVTPWQVKPARDELSNCQRFYCVFSVGDDYSQGTTSTALYRSYRLPVTMRAAPSITPSSFTYYSAGTTTACTAANGPTNVDYVGVRATGLTNANGFVAGTVTATADL